MEGPSRAVQELVSGCHGDGMGDPPQTGCRGDQAGSGYFRRRVHGRSAGRGRGRGQTVHAQEIFVSERRGHSDVAM